MDRKDVLEKLNKSFQGNSLNANEYLSLLTEFLEKKHPDKVSPILQLVMSQPMLLGQTVPTVKEYFIKEYNICTLSKFVDGNYLHICFIE